MDIHIRYSGTINMEALDSALRAQLGGAFFGLSHSGENVVLHLAEGTPAAAVERARQLVLTHDPEQLTPEQQAARERRQRLQQARDEKGAELNPADYSTDPLLLTLARKILWLEREISDLRDGGN